MNWVRNADDSLELATPLFQTSQEKFAAAVERLNGTNQEKV